MSDTRRPPAWWAFRRWVRRWLPECERLLEERPNRDSRAALDTLRWLAEEVYAGTNTAEEIDEVLVCVAEVVFYCCAQGAPWDIRLGFDRFQEAAVASLLSETAKSAGLEGLVDDPLEVIVAEHVGPARRGADAVRHAADPGRGRAAPVADLAGHVEEHRAPDGRRGPGAAAGEGGEDEGEGGPEGQGA